uniref:Uncharacterized protein n=2 Tax=Aegilops tauschii subsp. strangulata TaxID=200361 RepID=A0A453P2Q0_AEGTS
MSSPRLEMLFSSLFYDSASSENFSGHPGVERCPFLRNINGATTFSFSSALPVSARGSKGLIFEDGPGFESAFKLFHGQDGIVPLSGRSYVPDENRSEITDVNPEPALPFNPFAARAATISLSTFGPFGFNFYNGKGKKQNKKPNNLDQSHKKPNKPDQNSMKARGRSWSDSRGAVEVASHGGRVGQCKVVRSEARLRRQAGRGRRRSGATDGGAGTGW